MNDHSYRSILVALVPDLWWVRYDYLHVDSSEPNAVSISHLCPANPDDGVTTNELPLERITGPGITYPDVIECLNCGDRGALTCGRWEPVLTGVMPNPPLRLVEPK